MMAMWRTVFISFFLLIFTLDGFSQETIKLEILNADRSKTTNKKNLKLNRLIGNVKLRHKGVDMYCDSAYHYEKDGYFEAFSRVRIEQGDSIQLLGSYLHYDIDKRIAYVKDDVKLSDRDMSLYTDYLVYDMENNVAYYTDSAMIIDKENKLSSIKGYYYSDTKNIFFKEKVKLRNIDYRLNCDTLQYNTNTHIATFLSPTYIYADSTEIYTEKGWYNTDTKTSVFKQNAFIKSKNQQIFGNYLFFDNASKYARAKGGVMYTDTTENYEIRGGISEHFDEEETTYITDSALFIQYMDDDTLYLHADTLSMIPDSSGENNILRAYYGVRAFSRNFQVTCDSMIYSPDDSIITFYTNPVLWNENNQMTGVSISFYLYDGKINKMIILDDAMMISENDSSRFNQVKGRLMTGYFSDNKLSEIEVNGNAESLYFIKDDYEKYIGRNKITSSDIIIHLDENKISKIEFLNAPSGKVVTPLEMDNQEAFLRGFIWQKKIRPKSEHDLF
jgi:lipopolysaccharide export system protein LptA